MAGLAAYFTISALMALFLWMMDTWLLWVVGYIGFGMFLPLAVASWISLVVSRKWADKGKPKPNFMAIYSGVTGSFLLAALTYGIIIYNTDIGTAEERGYSIITLFILVPILFMECLVTTICAVTRKKQQPVQSYGAYVNPQFNAPYGNMQGGMPYGNKTLHFGHVGSDRCRADSGRGCLLVHLRFQSQLRREGRAGLRRLRLRRL